MRKSVLITLLCTVTLSANAQIFKSRANESDKSELKFTKQVDLYLQDKWGIGFVLRRESSPHFGWNLIGASYMSGWHANDAPKKFGIVNARLCGFRFNIPIYRNIKFYVEAMPGYSYVYRELRFPAKYQTPFGGETIYERVSSKSHCFGLDSSTGFQVLKNVSIGYNYTFLTTISDDTDNIHIHWGRVSVMF